MSGLLKLLNFLCDKVLLCNNTCHYCDRKFWKSDHAKRGGLIDEEARE